MELLLCLVAPPLARKAEDARHGFGDLLNQPFEVVALLHAWVPSARTVEAAEEERFELPVGCPTVVFKTTALDHSATPPVRRPEPSGKARCVPTPAPTLGAVPSLGTEGIDALLLAVAA
jgi:hypothetical protein